MVKEKIAICDKKITLRELYRVYTRGAELVLDAEVLEKTRKSRLLLEDLERRGEAIYGVTTGFGAQGDLHIPPQWRSALQEGVIEYHGAGVGPVLDENMSRAVFFTRIVSLCRGVSGIRPELLEHMAAVFNAGIAPVIPSRGSVGASGDLTPLSYLAAVLAGGRRVWYRGEVKNTREVFEERGIQPWKWEMKEGLALMNGTAVMTALAGVYCCQTESLAAWADACTALGAAALNTPREPFEDWVHRQKHHPGPRTSGEIIRRRGGLDPTPISDPARPSHRIADTPSDPGFRESMRRRSSNIQPRYSLRCAPQMNGVLWDTLQAIEAWIEDELNSANDNPLFDTQDRRVYHTGNFFGGHISAACDYLRIALSTTTTLMDRQVQQLLDSRGILPDNLVPPGEEGVGMGDEDPWNGQTRQGPRFGLKALGITTSALAAEAQHTAGPVSVLTRPTESQNQDVVSMGTVSALKLGEALDLAYLCAAHGLAVAGQAWELRFGSWLAVSGLGSDSGTGPGSAPALVAWLRERVPFVEGNKELGMSLECLTADMRIRDSRDI